MWGTLDTWIHAIELLLVVLVVPSVRTLIRTLLSLQQSVILLTQSMTDHRTQFATHVTEDHGRFADVDNRLNSVDGNVREVMGILNGRRSGHERREGMR